MSGQNQSQTKTKKKKKGAKSEAYGTEIINQTHHNNSPTPPKIMGRKK